MRKVVLSISMFAGAKDRPASTFCRIVWLFAGDDARLEGVDGDAHTAGLRRARDLHLVSADGGDETTIGQLALPLAVDGDASALGRGGDEQVADRLRRRPGDRDRTGTA